MTMGFRSLDDNSKDSAVARFDNISRCEETEREKSLSIKYQRAFNRKEVKSIRTEGKRRSKHCTVKMSSGRTFFFFFWIS